MAAQDIEEGGIIYKDRNFTSPDWASIKKTFILLSTKGERIYKHRPPPLLALSGHCDFLQVLADTQKLLENLHNSRNIFAYSFILEQYKL